MKLNKQFLLYGTSDFDIDIQIAKRTFVAKKKWNLEELHTLLHPHGYRRSNIEALGPESISQYLTH